MRKSGHILVWLLILGALVAAVFIFTSYQKQTNELILRTGVQYHCDALKKYHGDNGKYPTDAPSILEALRPYYFEIPQIPSGEHKGNRALCKYDPTTPCPETTAYVIDFTNYKVWPNVLGRDSLGQDYQGSAYMCSFKED